MLKNVRVSFMVTSRILRQFLVGLQRQMSTGPNCSKWSNSKENPFLGSFFFTMFQFIRQCDAFGRNSMVFSRKTYSPGGRNKSHRLSVTMAIVLPRFRDEGVQSLYSLRYSFKACLPLFVGRNSKRRYGFFCSTAGAFVNIGKYLNKLSEKLRGGEASLKFVNNLEWCIDNSDRFFCLFTWFFGLNLGLKWILNADFIASAKRRKVSFAAVLSEVSLPRNASVDFFGSTVPSPPQD